MFNGIIKEVGIIKSINSEEGQGSVISLIKTFIITASNNITQKPIGASIAVDGVCLTITAKTTDSFQVVAMPETLSRTICGTYQIGAKVNLETPMQLGEDISGHPVLGHVDTMGEILNIEGDEKSKIFEISFSKEIAKYLAFKGSVCINGISLTISKLKTASLQVSIIPHTLENTNLNSLKKGDSVNIEVDMFARYLERLIETKDSQVKYEYLQERGFL